MSRGHHVFLLPCLEPGATRTLEMRLLEWDLGQRSLVLVPAEHKAENVTQTWWAGGDIHLHGRHRESGHAHSHSQVPSRLWWSRGQFGQGCIWWMLAAQRREGTLPQHSWEQWRGSAGLECPMGFMPEWVFDQTGLWSFLLDWPENV